jgi:hypothetical protein
LIAYSCDLDVRDCEFTKNGNAVYMSSPKSAYFENVSIKENTGWVQSPVVLQREELESIG